MSAALQKVNFACSSSKMAQFPQRVQRLAVRKNRSYFMITKFCFCWYHLFWQHPRFWQGIGGCTPWTAWEQKGEFIDVVLRLRDFPECFHKYFYMTVEQFDELLILLEPHIKKQQTNNRKPISPVQRLAVCLRHVSHLHQNKQKISIHNVTHTKHDHFTSCNAWPRGSFSEPGT